MKKRNYKYIFGKKGEHWRFQLMPNNSNTQPVAVSCIYDSKGKAFEGLRRFQNFMQSEYSRSKVLFHLSQKTSGEYVSFQIFFAENEYLESARAYQKREVNNGLKRVETRYNAPIKE